jgi:hypothetical protein
MSKTAILASGPNRPRAAAVATSGGSVAAFGDEPDVARSWAVVRESLSCR